MWMPMVNQFHMGLSWKSDFPRKSGPDPEFNFATRNVRFSFKKLIYLVFLLTIFSTSNNFRYVNAFLFPRIRCDQH